MSRRQKLKVGDKLLNHVFTHFCCFQESINTVEATAVVYVSFRTFLSSAMEACILLTNLRMPLMDSIAPNVLPNTAIASYWDLLPMLICSSCLLILLILLFSPKMAQIKQKWLHMAVCTLDIATVPILIYAGFSIGRQCTQPTMCFMKIAFCSLTLLLALVLASFCLKFYFKNNFQVPIYNVLARRHCLQLELNSIAECMIVIIASIRGQSMGVYTERLVYLLGLVLVALHRVKILAQYSVYLVEFTRNLGLATAIIDFNSKVIAFVLAAVTDVLLDDNWLFILIVTTILSGIGAFSYINHLRGKILFSQVSSITEIEEAVLYIYCLRSIAGELPNQKEAIVRSSLRKGHEMSCNDISCYCRNQTLNYTEFTKLYIKACMSAFQKAFPESLEITILISTLLLEVYKEYTNVVEICQTFKNREGVSLAQNFSLFCLASSAVHYINRKNKEKAVIDIDTVLSLEEILFDLQSSLKKDLVSRQLIWNTISKRICFYQDINNHIAEQRTTIYEINRTCEQHLQKYSLSWKFNILALFYYTRVSFLPAPLEVFQKNLAMLSEQSKVEKNLSLGTESSLLYTSQSCVLELKVSSHNLGIVSNCSKNILQVFGYTNKRLIGLNINTIMPSFLAEAHNLVLKTWMSTGTWRTIGKFKEIFCINHDQQCFTALIYLKLRCSTAGLYLLGSITKINSEDYLITNPNWEIISMGSVFNSLIGKTQRKLALEEVFINSQQIVASAKLGVFQEARRLIERSPQKLNSDARDELQSFCSSSSDSDSFSSESQSSLIQYFQIEFEYKLERMMNIHYLVIRLINSRRVTDQQTADNYEKLRLTPLKLVEELYAVTSSSSEFNDIDINIKFEKASSIDSWKEQQSFNLSKMFIDLYADTLNKKSSFACTRLAYHFGFAFIAVCTLGLCIAILIAEIYVSEDIETAMKVNLNAQFNLVLTQALLFQIHKFPVNHQEVLTFFSTISDSFSRDQAQLFNEKLKLINKPVNGYILDQVFDVSHMNTSIVLRELIFSSLSFIRYHSQINQTGNHHHLFGHLSQTFGALNKKIVGRHKGIIEDYIQIDNFILNGLSAIVTVCLILLCFLLNLVMQRRHQVILQAMAVLKAVPCEAAKSLEHYYSLLSREYSQRIENNDRGKIQCLCAPNEEQMLKVKKQSVSFRGDMNNFINSPRYWHWVILLILCSVYIIGNWILSQQLLNVDYLLNGFMDQQNLICDGVKRMLTALIIYAHPSQLTVQKLTKNDQLFLDAKDRFERGLFMSYSMIEQMSPSKNYGNQLNIPICELQPQQTRQICHLHSKKLLRLGTIATFDQIMSETVTNSANYMLLLLEADKNHQYQIDRSAHIVEKSNVQIFKYMVMSLRQILNRLNSEFNQITPTLYINRYKIFIGFQIAFVTIVIIVWIILSFNEPKDRAELCSIFLLIPSVVYRESKGLIQLSEITLGTRNRS